MNLQHQFNHTRIQQLRPAAFAVLDRIQGLAPGEQVMAVAVALRVMVEGAGLDMSQVLNAAERCMRDADALYQHHVGAIRDYARHELGREPVAATTHEEIV